MDDPTLVVTVVTGVIQVALMLLVAPLLLGITKRVKARLQYRRGPALLQPYRDLAKWWHKEVVESDAASPMTAMAPPLMIQRQQQFATLMIGSAERTPMNRPPSSADESMPARVGGRQLLPAAYCILPTNRNTRVPGA